MECRRGVQVWSAGVECRCGVQAWSAGVECGCGVQAWWSVGVVECRRGECRRGGV